MQERANRSQRRARTPKLIVDAADDEEDELNPSSSRARHV